MLWTESVAIEVHDLGEPVGVTRDPRLYPPQSSRAVIPSKS